MGLFSDLFPCCPDFIWRAFFMSKKNNSFTSFDKQMMQRCIELAAMGSGFTAPNPMVGAVIVKNGQVIAEGYHEYFGGPHAEIVAINNTQESLKGAHLYVNLEPCSHHGKTPPCSLAIINQEFEKVFIATEDPNPLVSGKGIKALKKKGIEVAIGLLEDEARKLNEKFFHFITRKTPFVAIKTASSLDGKITTYSGESQWITGEISRKKVHELRHEYSAILVGINTILNDNPYLTSRLDRETKNPTKIVLDTSLKTPLNSHVMDDISPLIIATTRMASKAKIKEYEQFSHVQVWECPMKDGLVDIQFLLNKLGQNGIDSILVEGGGSVNYSFVHHKHAQKLYSFVAPIIIGGYQSKPSFAGKGVRLLSEAPRLKNISRSILGDDFYMEGYF